MSTAEVIAARREVLALLVEAGADGLQPTELIDECMRRVKGLTIKEARAVLVHLSAGGPGRDLPNIHLKSGRWMTHMKVAPSPVTVREIVEEPPQRDPELVAEDEQLAREQREALEAPQEDPMSKVNEARDAVLALLGKKKAWLSTPEVVAAVKGGGRALKELVAEKLVKRFGKSRATRYSLASLKLAPPAKDDAAAPERAPRKASVRRGGAASDNPALDHIDAEIATTEDRLTKLHAARDALVALAA